MILRNQSRERFTVISNACLEDDRLSWEARGVLAYLLSKPDQWRIKYNQLQQAGNCGRDKVLRIFRELRDTGYLVTKHLQDANGKMTGKEVWVCEKSSFPELRQTRTSESSNFGKADPLVNTEGLSNTEGDQIRIEHIRAVFDFWREKTDHPRAKLDAKRERKIRDRLKDGYTELDLMAAVEGLLLSPHHMGRNDNKTVYDDIELVCRDAKHVDMFLKIRANPPSQTSQRTDKNLAAAQRFAGRGQ